ncbi:MAG TPA: gluconate 2-dehydrogenase subunit 3 family protein [Terriglobia bacterium]|nr:gluconate 2-dehydrogenase subunit 3 family protein [Terriglobia bacterium]
MSLLTATEAGRAFVSGWLPAGTNRLDASEEPVKMADPSDSARSLDQNSAYAPQFFKPDEFRTVEILTEMIIPTDDKPGAREARVASYIDFIVFSAAEFRPQLQREWIAGLELVNHDSRTKYGKPFNEISSGQREALLTAWSLPERNSQASIMPQSPARRGGPVRPSPGWRSKPVVSSGPETNASQASHPGYRFYRLVKEMTVEGFYSSRVGLMEVLEYKGLTYLSSFPGCTHPEHHEGSEE